MLQESIDCLLERRRVFCQFTLAVTVLQLIFDIARVPMVAILLSLGNLPMCNVHICFPAVRKHNDS